MLHGRDADLARGVAVLDEVTGGGGAGAVVLEAEAGMGKTSLLGALLAEASSRGFAVLEGRGHALGRGVAYGPIAAALGRHLHGVDPDERRRLVDGLDSLGRLIEGLETEARTAPDPDVERSRLVQSVARLLGRIAAERAVVLAVDDLHWADSATLELLDHLVTELQTERVALVTASRPGATAARPDVRHVIGRLRRLPVATRIELAPLDRVAIAEVAADRLGGPVSAALLDEVAARTGGVALAVDAVVRELRDGGVVEQGPEGWRATGPIAVPTYVVDLFEERVVALPPAARAVLAAVVVADEALERDELDALVDGAPDVRPAVGAGLLVELPSGAWDVRHPLVAEAVDRAIDEGERRALHAALAAHLAGRGDPVLDRRARHVVGAGALVPDDEAVDVLARAGRRALRSGAADPAARWLSAAVVRATPAAPAAPRADLGALLVDAADAWERCDELGAALDAITRAVDVLADHDPSAASRAATTAARLCWQVGRPEQGEWHRRALDLAATSPERLQVRYEAIGALMREGRPDEAKVAADLLRPDAAGAEGALGAAARHRLVAVDVLLLGDRADRLVDEAPVLPAGAPPALVAAVEGGVLEALVLLGRWDEVTRQADATLARLGPDATLTGLSWRPVVARVHAAVATGSWDLASDLVTDLPGHSMAAATSRGFWLGLLAALRGEVDAAHAATEEARRGNDLASLPLHAGALDVVDAYAELVAGSAPPSIGPRYRPGSFNALSHLAVSAAAAEVLLARGEAEGAADVAAALHRWGAPGTAAGVLADRIDALAAGSAEALEAVAQGYDGLGMPFDAARARLEAAERAPGARPLPATVVETFERLGAAPWVERATARSGGAVARDEPARTEILTPREREVAELVAEGLTNAQIAERLVVSIRTVTSHLDHAYTKLGIGSRAALTAHLLRGGPGFT